MFDCILIGYSSQSVWSEIGQKIPSNLFNHLSIPTIKPTAGVGTDKKSSWMPLDQLDPFRSKAVACKYAASVEVAVNWALCGNLADHVRMPVKESS